MESGFLLCLEYMFEGTLPLSSKLSNAYGLYMHVYHSESIRRLSSSVFHSSEVITHVGVC